jgi:uncharacterized protein (TIGR00369 family)
MSSSGEALVPADFQELPPLSPYLDALGPFHWKSEGEARTIGVHVQRKHINSRGFVHGGFLCTLVDTALGYNLSLRHEPPLPLVTASMTVDFTGAALLGDWLEARVEVHKTGRRLAFASCHVFRGAERIIRASGVFAVVAG